VATLVLDLKDRRPLLAFPEWAREAIASAAPAGWTTAVPDVPADGSGDGVARTSPELLAEAADARVYMGYGVPAEFVRAAPRLEWVHSGAAGVASSLGPELLARDVRFTNSAGIHGPPVAETVLAAMLYFARGLDLAARAQREGRWAGDDFWGAGSPVAEMSASVVGVVGYGGIGAGIARRARAFGMRTMATKRRAPEDPNLDVHLRPERLGELLEESDYVVLCVPLTDETDGLIGAAELARMRAGAMLINVARGRVLDAEALGEALRRGKIAHAVLDVAPMEPLPADSPLWDLPNCTITPHDSGHVAEAISRTDEFFLRNLARLGRGEALEWVVEDIGLSRPNEGAI